MKTTKIVATFGLAFGMLCSSHKVRALPVLSKDEKLWEFSQLVGSVQASYGPYYYKQGLHWFDEKGMKPDQPKIMDLQKIVEGYQSKIALSRSNSEYYYLMRQFVAEFHDGHFSLTIPTDHAKSLPFTTDYVQGKVLIDEVSKDLGENKNFDFVKGDEIVSVDGKPIAEYISGMQKYYGAGFDLSEKRMASFSVALRTGRSIPVPRSPTVRLEIRRGDSVRAESVLLKWKESGTPMDEYESTSEIPSVKMQSHTSASSRASYSQISIRAMWEEQGVSPELGLGFRCSGGTRTAIPEGATMLLKEPFVAYYWPTAKGNVGYLRIPHYSPTNSKTGADESELRFRQYENILAQLEEKTVGLVIDQDHNCGGSVDFLERMLTLFIPREFDNMQFQFFASKPEYLMFKKWLTEIEGLGGKATNEYQRLEKVSELILKTTELKGSDKEAPESKYFLTEKTSFQSNAKRKPNADGVYTKPIVMLIDELSGSGGDAFPAMMGGVGRATLLGTRTMGAGGHVQEQPDLPFSALHYRMTRSLFFRPDGVAVENNGAVPSVPYEITPADHKFGFRDYRAFYTQELLKLVP